MGRLWWRRTPHPAAAGSPAWRGTAVFGAVVGVLGAGMVHYIPGPPRGHAADPPPAAVRTVAVFHHIVLPDLAVTDPAGVSAAGLRRLAKAHGVRQVLPLDGARITVGSAQVSVIGVNAQLYRSWTPLSTASNERLWNGLTAGGFIATPAVRHQLGLLKGSSYPVTGATTVDLPYVGGAPLGIGGIDMVVAARVSARLGLVHHVAVLVSAPSLSIGKLKREVRAAVGHGPKLVTLRVQSPATQPVAVNTSKRPVNYIQLFQESAALYCPGLPWTVLAAIGQIESADGQNMGPSSAGALGPMQFLPSTWARWGTVAFGETGPPNVMDPYDAVPSAARYLCAAGGSTAAGLPRAIFAYNHADWYVAEVLALARQYAKDFGG
jgi:hypothetical protein